MRFPGALLRILLCVMLVLNGSTLASAAVHHALASAADVGDVAGVQSVTDCHDAASDTVPADTAAGDTMEPEGSELPACCQASGCAGVCLMSVSASVSPLVLACTSIDHSAVADAPAPSFLSLIPHPSIRPPIAPPITQ